MARGMEIDEKSMGGNASCPETQNFKMAEANTSVWRDASVLKDDSIRMQNNGQGPRGGGGQHACMGHWLRRQKFDLL